MKRAIGIVCALALCAAQGVFSQSTTDSSSQTPETPEMAAVPAQHVVPKTPEAIKPFSRVALGAGVSPLGVGMEVVTDLNQHFNVRMSGNLFNYSTSFTTSGVTANAKLNFASAGATLDVYPFHKGFRLSPGVLFLNDNQLTATANMPGGTSFTFNGQTYYSANTNATTGATPMTGSGGVILNANKPAFTVTTGWGNHIQRNGHWSVPFELGVAFIGAPTINVNLAGWACTDQAQTQCGNIADPNNSVAVQVQSNLKTQIAKWNSDIEPLKTYPILSVGVAYSFRVRK